MKIAIADNQSHVRAALRLLITEQTRHAIALEIDDPALLLEGLETTPVNLLIIDWTMLAEAAHARVQQLRHFTPELKIIVISSDPAVRSGAIDAGADRFFSKSTSPDRLLSYLQSSRRPCE